MEVVLPGSQHREAGASWTQRNEKSEAAIDQSGMRAIAFFYSFVRCRTCVHLCSRQMNPCQRGCTQLFAWLSFRPSRGFFCGLASWQSPQVASNLCPGLRSVSTYLAKLRLREKRLALQVRRCYCLERRSWRWDCRSLAWLRSGRSFELSRGPSCSSVWLPWPAFANREGASANGHDEVASSSANGSSVVGPNDDVQLIGEPDAVVFPDTLSASGRLTPR